MRIILIIFFIFLTFPLYNQSNNNGKLDLISELSTIIKVPFTMPDGVKLDTDIYLPIFSDSVTVDFNGYNIEIIPKGTQIIIYDSIGNSLNPNKYQLPLIFTRTPYGKDSDNELGIFLNILGYAYAYQDMRGRYESEGVYLPMYSDSWEKITYHPTEKHILDITDLNSEFNGNKHQDGKNSIQFIMDSLYRYYDLDGDAVLETYDKMYNGSIAMLGASALGNTQYQAASSLKIDVTQDGLKGLIPIVATNEYFNTVIQHNGVFRESLVEGWLTGQLNHNTNIDISDFDVQNSIHSIFDYGIIPQDTIMNRGVGFTVSIPDENGFTGMYPNNTKRYDSDASIAMVNNIGESDINGVFSRYTNLELPIYHLTGWWDIFIDGQINTYNNVMKHTSLKTQRNQKLVIGPWTHGNIAQDSVSDLIFPPSIFDLNIIDYKEALSGNFSELFKGELIDWFRYLLNYNPNNLIGEPSILIPESDHWQFIGDDTYIRIPSEDFQLSYSNFVNFIGGFNSLDSIPIQFSTDTIIHDSKYNIPAITAFELEGNEPVTDPVSPPVNFEDIPNIRYYIPGPIDDGEPLNNNVGNYWTSTENFPLTTGVNDYVLFFHNDGSLNSSAPSEIEPVLEYIHNPNDPIQTIGGGNLTINTYEGIENRGPMDYANPLYAPKTMDRSGVLQFETDFIVDSLSIVGIPTAKIYASSNPLSGPEGLTDTDFFIRILDVYPNGKEIFVVEGAVNARARNYSKLLANNIEDINVAYSNINSGDIYEFEFNLLPIAYAFGHNHKLKILISSSNWPRYQCNANLPINQGDFFRHKPNDNQTYIYNTTEYIPREAKQKIYFTPTYKSQITLPFLGDLPNTRIKELSLEEIEWFVFPNPTKDYLRIEIRNKLFINSTIEIYDVLGRKILTKVFKNKTVIKTSNIISGVYFLTIETDGNKFSQKIIIK